MRSDSCRVRVPHPRKAALGLIPDYGGSLRVLGAEVRDADKPSLAAAVAYAQQAPFVLTGEWSGVEWSGVEWSAVRQAALNTLH
eukprot:SAG22_NODE_6845_length_804_cov_1.960284_2_plen_83_part_01